MEKMHKEKQDRRLTIKNFKNDTSLKEAEDRAKFNSVRSEAAKNIAKSLNDTWITNQAKHKE